MDAFSVFMIILHCYLCVSKADEKLSPASPSYQPCSEVSSANVHCIFNSTCRYGQTVDVACKSLVPCQFSDGAKDSIHFRKATCRYCHQLTNETDFICKPSKSDCTQPGVARSFYVAECRAQPSVICMGRKEFLRMRPCTRKSGKSYVTTVILSLFLGGLGADRFYLGMWREGLGKLFTFGGLGVWSVIDFILIFVGYICPPDDMAYWGTVPPD
ncbi:unnamed protein product [Mesocestoides corti]|uniref:TM2 domain-containing protein n=1 Tax=Mesocestoides corti TaxID=53468 RepID=A0A0R3UFB7_MESCO|nr:unnamed protein product [Mesocestoides corti]